MRWRIDVARRRRLIEALTPRLAGASIRERLVASVGALIGIGLTGVICGLAAGYDLGLPLLVAPMGATAVLLFAVPSSPLAQPWSIVGGNTLSALTAVAVIHLVPQPAVAAAVAVAAAIAVMSLFRCLHPPGGAAALLVALMGPDGPAGSFSFALFPVGLNSLAMVMLGLGFHRLSGHDYPHLPKPLPPSPHGTRDMPPQLRQGVSDADIDMAIAESGEVFDIGRDDLARLIRRAEMAALHRVHDVPRCAEVMSRDVLTIAANASPDEARNLILERGVRTLPVVDDLDHVLGVVGLRNLLDQAERVVDAAIPAAVAQISDSVLKLVDLLSDGHTHAVVILDGEKKLAGLVTQTDLVSVLARLAVSGVPSDRKPAS